MKNKLVWIIPLGMLVIALAPLPYAYYQIMRWVVAGCAAYIAYKDYQAKEELNIIVLLFSGIAILYNPIAPIHLFREAWMFLNALTVAVFGYGSFRNQIFKKEE